MTPTTLDALDACEIAVIGDLILDCYVQGDVERVSREAPVPVVRWRSERYVPGGAANVASNLAAMGARVRIVGTTGHDEAAKRLVEALKERGHIDSDGIVVCPDRATTRKMRVISGQQQVARIDTEHMDALPRQYEDELIRAALAAMAKAQIVIASDYGYNVLSDRVLREVIDEAKRAGKRLLVDPRRNDWSAYRGASILTPNRRELTDATGLPCESDEQAELAVKRARQVCDADILLTRSEKGMSFYRADGPTIHVPTVARDVFDVSGAGDTVIAVLAAGLALDMEPIEAVKMANHAAGIVVGKFGTATVAREELMEFVHSPREAEALADGRLVDRSEAVALRREWGRHGLTVGLTNGCFDLIHPGHIAVLRQAAASCDRLIVALNSDTSVKRLKGPSRPVQDELSRAQVIGAIKGVSVVTLFSEDTPIELLRALQPDVLIKGADYAEATLPGADIVKSRGGRVVLATLVPDQSTTRLLKRNSIP
jgi:D-beta-D-heptose 7-phosphate kinase/D-beta-D-heptose 1-phosphate adenosyltransferase